eukprot:1172798-Rhodomonas_salina.1
MERGVMGVEEAVNAGVGSVESKLKSDRASLDRGETELGSQIDQLILCVGLLESEVGGVRGWLYRQGKEHEYWRERRDCEVDALLTCLREAQEVLRAQWAAMARLEVEVVEKEEELTKMESEVGACTEGVSDLEAKLSTLMLEHQSLESYCSDLSGENNEALDAQQALSSQLEASEHKTEMLVEQVAKLHSTLLEAGCRALDSTIARQSSGLDTATLTRSQRDVDATNGIMEEEDGETPAEEEGDAFHLQVRVCW